MASTPPLIGALLRTPWEVVRERLLAGLHERGFDDLAAAHLNVLQYPGPDGARPSELAVRMRASRQAVNYLLGQMEEMDYVERRGEAASRTVHLTARGERAVRAAREIVTGVEREWAERLGPEEFARLRELLGRLNEVATAT